MICGPSDFRIAAPKTWLKAVRSVNGREEIAFVGYPSRAVPAGRGEIRFTFSGPEGLVADRLTAFPPPMIEHATAPDAFAFWWSVIDYTLDLPDPTPISALPVELDEVSRRLISRYVQTARDLAASAVLNALGGGLVVDIEDHTDIEHITADFGPRDRQAGFAVLLRQCDSADDDASYQHVSRALIQANERDVADRHYEQRGGTIRAWARAIGQLHGRSLNQLLREKLVREHDLRILEYDEPDPPERLIAAFNYGDLLHWDIERAPLAAWERDDYRLAERRSEFFRMATSLTHLHLGFATVAATATAL